MTNIQTKQGWYNTKLNDVCSKIFSGGTPNTQIADYWNGPFYWLSSGETRNTFITKTEKTITQVGIENSSTRLAKKHSVVIATAGQGLTRGQTSFLLVDTYINQSVISLETQKEILDPLFLFYNLQSRYRELRALSDANSSRGSITTQTLKSLQILLPSILIQQKIASILSAFDHLIENNTKRIKILENTAKLIYKEWFVDYKFPGHEKVKMGDSDTEFGKIPAGWEMKEIGDLITLKKGKNITKNTIVKGDVPVVAGGLTPAYYHNVGNTNEPVVTISASGANSGYVNLYQETVWASDCSFIDKTITENVYFYYLFLITNQEQVTGLQRGSAQPHVYPKDLMRLKIVAPPGYIINQFSILIESLFLEWKFLQKQNQNLIKTRDLLLPKLVSGEVEVDNLTIK